MIKSGLSLIFRHTLNVHAFKKLPSTKILMKNVRYFSQKKQQPVSQANGQGKTQNQVPKKKLSQYDFDELIEMHTQESLIAAETRVEQEQKKITLNHQILVKLAQDMQYLAKHAQDIKAKELKLVQNIEQQQQQLKRVNVRATRQIDDSKKFSITKIAKELLEAADCINRCKNEAVKQYPDSKDPYIVGIVETQKKLAQILKNFDIQEFDPINKEYDPNTQQSLLQIPCPPGFNPGTVATTMRTGYYIQGRLLRSARVGIFSK